MIANACRIVYSQQRQRSEYMPEQKDALSDEERRAALEELAVRVGKDIPEAVADNLSEPDLRIAYVTG
jgi:hypothetical protein